MCSLLVQVTEDSGTQLKWLQAICGCLTDEEAGLGSIAGFYPCLSALLQLNHLSVEPFLSTIWAKVLDQDDLVRTMTNSDMLTEVVIREGDTNDRTAATILCSDGVRSFLCVGSIL